MIHWRKKWGLFWPDYDAAPERTHAYVLKHLGDCDMTIEAAKNRRVCIQAGGHVGLWPLKLAEHFDQVITFEPDPALFACLQKNTAKARNIICRQEALGMGQGMAYMLKHVKAGSWSIVPPVGQLTSQHVGVVMTTVDHVAAELDLQDCGALVFDIEGYEVEALKGAALTIDRFAPVVHLEELGSHRMRSAAHMKSIGYTEHSRAGRDALYISLRRGTRC